MDQKWRGHICQQGGCYLNISIVWCTIILNIFIIVIFIGRPILNCMIHYNVCKDKGKYCAILCATENYCGRLDLVIPLAHRAIGFKTRWSEGRSVGLTGFLAGLGPSVPRCSHTLLLYYYAIFFMYLTLSLREAAHSGSGVLAMGREAALSGSPNYPGQF